MPFDDRHSRECPERQLDRAQPGRGEMKRTFIPAAIVAAGVLVFAVVNATAGSSRSREGGTIHVIEHATTDAVTNGIAGDSAGNVLTFVNDVFDSANAKKAGTDQGYCVRIVVPKSWEYEWT